MARPGKPMLIVRSLLPLALVLPLLFLSAGCHRPADQPTTGPAQTGHVTWLVAASAQDAAEAAARAFEARTKIAVRISPGPSNALANQVLMGAPADLFLSASPEWTDALAAHDLLAARRPLLSNALVLVVPVGNPAAVRAPADLRSAAVRHVALAGENVPVGRYAEQALRHAGVFEALVQSGRIVRGRDVHAALTFVASGDADAGIVYASDTRPPGSDAARPAGRRSAAGAQVAAGARSVAGVECVHTFPPQAHDRTVYPLALLDSAENPPAARALYDYLATDEALSIFERYGFLRAD